MFKGEQICESIKIAKVWIIILNWNGLLDTLECLCSVYRLDYLNYEVIVVDNASSDGSVEKIRKAFPQVCLIENSINLGYSGGNNVGIRYAMQNGADYVWLLNNDTIVETDVLSKLVDEAEKSSGIGLVSPVIHFYSHPEEIQFMGSYVDFAKFTLVHIDDPEELALESVGRNLSLWGTALFIKRSVIETVGFLSEKYFAYHEDMDYAFRALKENFTARMRLDARIFHKDSRSSGKQSPLQTFLRTRNLYFLWKAHSPGFRKTLVPGYYLGMVIENARFLCLDGNERAFDACVNGAWAAFVGRGGAYDPTFSAPSLFKKILSFFAVWHPYLWVNLFSFNMKGIALELKKRFASML